MAGTLTISTLSDGTNSTSATNCIQGSAKAWVNFQGATTPTINTSYNVSSITQVSGGTYTVNFTNAFVDTNYVIMGTAANTGGNRAVTFYQNASVAPTTTTCQMWYYDTVVGHVNPNQKCYVSFFR